MTVEPRRLAERYAGAEAAMSVPVPRRLRGLDEALTAWMATYGVRLLRVSLGVVFVWFGALKLFAGVSPAEDLALSTLDLLTPTWVSREVARVGLGVWEILIGLGLISGRFLRVTIALLFLQMLGAMSPIFLLPERVFVSFPFVLTLEGQYIVKNVVLISAALVIGATVRGGHMVACAADDPARKPR
jgi:uncharacterized membrane protein YkgB